MRQTQRGAAIFESILLLGLIALIGYVSIENLEPQTKHQCASGNPHTVSSSDTRTRHLNADLNHDRCVDFQDLWAMAYSYNSDFHIADLEKLAQEYNECVC